MTGPLKVFKYFTSFSHRGRSEIIVFLSLNLQVREVLVAVAVIIRKLKQQIYIFDNEKE